MFRKTLFALLAIGATLPAMASSFSISATLLSSPLGQGINADLRLGYQTEVIPNLTFGINAVVASDLSDIEVAALTFLEYGFTLSESDSYSLTGYAGLEVPVGILPSFGFGVTTYAGLDSDFSIANGINILSGLWAEVYVLPSLGYSLGGYGEVDFNFNPFTLYLGSNLFVLPSFGYDAYAGVVWALGGGLDLKAEVAYDGELYGFLRLRARF